MLAAAKAVDVDGTLIGDVTDLMVDIVTGRIAYVVVSVGAMLGLGGERYAVPWSALSYDAEAGVFRLRLAKSALTDAPLVEREFWPEMTDDERWARAVHEHFGAIPVLGLVKPAAGIVLARGMLIWRGQRRGWPRSGLKHCRRTG